LAQAITTTRTAGATGQIIARADSAYYGHAFVAAALRAKAWFSVTARMNPQVSTAISRIPDDAWTPIQYPNAIWDHDQGRWISEAKVAETTCRGEAATPGAQARSNAITAWASQAALVAYFPDGRCASGPSLSSAMTCSMTAWSR